MLDASESKAEAAFHLAAMYILRDGGIAKNMTRAVQYFHKAGELRNTVADFQLGLIYEFGEEDIKQDLSKASLHYIRAAQKNHDQALTNSQRIDEQSKANKVLAYEVGLLYHQRKDKKNALTWFKKAADQGDENSYAKLNEMAQEDSQFACEVGQAYEKDSNNKAFDYYLIAAQRKHDKALAYLEALLEKMPDEIMEYELGIFYEKFIEDTSSALRWYKKSADKGKQEAIKQLQILANKNADVAFAIGCSYEKDTACPDYLAKLCLITLGQ